MSESGVNEIIAQIKELCYELKLKEAKREEETKKQELMENMVVDILKKGEEYCPYCGERLSAEKIREKDKHGRWYCNDCKSFFYRGMASRCPYCDSTDIHLAIRRGCESHNKRCSNCGAAFQEWIRPEPQNPKTIALLKSIELLGPGVHYPPHVCPNCKQYWWTYEDQMEDEQWPDDW